MTEQRPDFPSSPRYTDPYATDPRQPTPSPPPQQGVSGPRGGQFLPPAQRGYQPRGYQQHPQPGYQQPHPHGYQTPAYYGTHPGQAQPVSGTRKTVGIILIVVAILMLLGRMANIVGGDVGAHTDDAARDLGRWMGTLVGVALPLIIGIRMLRPKR